MYEHPCTGRVIHGGTSGCDSSHFSPIKINNDCTMRYLSQCGFHMSKGKSDV